jgi:hypothetical protein
MPDAKNNAKLTGDTHPPEVEDTVPGLPEDMPEAMGADGTPRDRGQDSALENEAHPGKGENQAGFLKDKDAPGRGKG